MSCNKHSKIATQTANRVAGSARGAWIWPVVLLICCPAPGDERAVTIGGSVAALSAAVPGCIPLGPGTTPGDAATTFRITQPGSYCLGGNLVGTAGKSGIQIDASDVTLDLNGFVLLGAAGSVTGVRIGTGSTRVTVRNGAARGWTLIGFDGGDGGSCVFDRLTAAACGSGIVTGNGSIVRNCVAEENEGSGILTGLHCSVTACTSRGNGAYGIYVLEGSLLQQCVSGSNGLDGFYLDGDGCAAIGCTAVSNAGRGITAIYNATILSSTAIYNTGDGIRALGPARVSECQASYNGASGIFAAVGGTVVDCSVRQNDKHGIELGSACSASGNHSNSQAAGAGVLIAGGHNRVEANHLTGNLAGLQATAGGNLIVRNSASDNGVGYEVAPGNALGPIVGREAVATDTSPHANYEF